VFNATFNNISVILWWLDLLVAHTGVPEENQPFDLFKSSLFLKLFVVDI
jgi:hypothetical protein